MRSEMRVLICKLEKNISFHEFATYQFVLTVRSEVGCGNNVDIQFKTGSIPSNEILFSLLAKLLARVLTSLNA